MVKVGWDVSKVFMDVEEKGSGLGWPGVSFWKQEEK